MKNELYMERFHGNGLKNLNSAVILKITPPKKKFGARGWHKESFLKIWAQSDQKSIFFKSNKVWEKKFWMHCTKLAFAMCLPQCVHCTDEAHIGRNRGSPVYSTTEYTYYREMTVVECMSKFHMPGNTNFHMLLQWLSYREEDEYWYKIRAWFSDASNLGMLKKMYKNFCK